MDPAHFDRLARLLGSRIDRRAALSLLTALGAGGILAPAPGVGAKKNKPKPCGACRRRVKGKCRPKPNGTPCGGGTCRAGVCAAAPASPPSASPPPAGGCAAGQRPCRGGCIPSNQCCLDGDCPGGRACQGGACGCPADRPLCPQVSAEQCCAPPPGMAVAGITCGAFDGAPACICAFRAADACASDCQSQSTVNTSCANPDAGLIRALCAELGCRPRE